MSHRNTDLGILRRSKSAKVVLGAIPSNVEQIRIKIVAAIRRKTNLHADEIIEDIQRIRNDLAIILSDRHFYYLRTDLAKSYGQPELFGER
ncbi:MAG TPA: hypothetical protein VGI32_00285, partial [Steroidobacteraceae bacterium]